MVTEPDIEVIISMLTAFIMMLNFFMGRKKEMCNYIGICIMANFVQHGIFTRMEKKYLETRKS